MPSVTCPSCGEKGRVPAQYVGIRIKCKKCGNAFLVAPPSKSETEAAPPAGKGSPSLAALVTESVPPRPRYEGIEVEGLDESAWSTGEVVRAEQDSEPDHPHDEATSAFTAQEPGAGGVKQYKVLSPRDAYFGGKFDLELLEKALNHYAKQGWVVKGFAAPHVQIFGAEREQIVIVMER